MFGLMTVARHERAVTELNAHYEGELEKVRADRTRWFDTVTDALTNAAAWQRMAESLRADLAELRKRELPPIPGPDESEIGLIADDEHTPSAIAKREKAVGAR